MSMAVRHGSHYCMTLCRCCSCSVQSNQRYGSHRTPDQTEGMRESERERLVEACRCSTPTAAALPPRSTTPRHTRKSKASDRCRQFSDSLIHEARKRTKKNQRRNSDGSIKTPRNSDKERMIMVQVMAIMNKARTKPSRSIERIDQNQAAESKNSRYIDRCGRTSR